MKERKARKQLKKEDIEKLSEYIKVNSTANLKKIGEEFNVSQMTISRLIRLYEIPYKKKTENLHLNFKRNK